MKPIEYETHDERHYAVLHRDAEDAPTDPCPFCGRRHTHGQGDGHRVAHCIKARARTVRLPSGFVLDCSHGYFVRTRIAGKGADQ